ncbi:MAG: glycosyltransferase [Pirellulales bacterium]|nr:glycosyltransferase [Pirellulales bacterium]
MLMPIYNERWTLAEIVRRVLASPVDLEIELVAVDDCSSDGSWELLQQLATADARIRPFRHAVNLGKGGAIRTAMDHMTGDLALVQDADLEYDPCDYPQLLEPLTAGLADAVFGSRYLGTPRSANHLWHTLVNRFLTVTSNLFTGLNLTDMETCYKLVRTDILRRLKIQAKTFTFEPELTSRLAQWGARIYEVPVRYEGRSLLEGKKIRPIDGVKALWEIFRSAMLDPQFTSDLTHYELTARQNARAEQKALAAEVAPHVGRRVLDVSAGQSSLGTRMLSRDHVVLADSRGEYVESLRRRFAVRENTSIEQADLFHDADLARWQQGRFDTVLCGDLLERVDDDRAALARLATILPEHGHLVVTALGGPLTAADQALGRRRRYTLAELSARVEEAGFEVVQTHESGKLSALLTRALGIFSEPGVPSPRQVAWNDRLLPLTRWTDRVLPSAGSRLTVVGRRRATTALRRAA